MHNDIEEIEESIKNEAKASQDRFAKVVAEEASLSIKEEVNSLVTQLDNKASIDNMKTKLEKIKEKLESFDLSSLENRIDDISKKIGSESELVSGVNNNLGKQSNCIHEIQNSIQGIHTVLNNEFDKFGKEETLYEIAKLKNTVKYMFFVNGITVIGIIGVLFVLLFR